MKKRSVKVITLGIVLVLLFSLAGLTACKGREIVETDYFRVELYKKDGYAIVLELTDLGKEQEILAVPMFVEGLPVKQLGRHHKMFGLPYAIRSANLKKIYLSHSIETIYKGPTLASDSVIIVNLVEIPDGYFANVKFWDTTLVHLNYTSQNLIPQRPNVVFRYNYNTSPNEDYYWFDYVTGSNKFMFPPSPVRENYNFAGWYLEPELITYWNGQMPQPEETLNLYAKWQEK